MWLPDTPQDTDDRLAAHDVRPHWTRESISGRWWWFKYKIARRYWAWRLGS